MRFVFGIGCAVAVLVGCTAASSRRAVEAPAEPAAAHLIEFAIVRATESPSTRRLVYRGEVLHVEGDPILTDGDLATIEPGTGASQRVLLFEVNPGSVPRLYEATSSNIGERLAILIEGRIVDAPFIRSGVGARGQIDLEPLGPEIERIFRIVRERSGR